MVPRKNEINRRRETNDQMILLPKFELLYYPYN